MFTRRQLRVLILPLIVEQFLAVTIGMADSVMVRAVSALCWHRGGQIGVFGVWVAMTIDWMVRAVVFIIRLLSGRWKKRRLV